MKFEKLLAHIHVDKALDRLIDDEELFKNILGMLIEDFEREKAAFENSISERSSKSVGEKAHYFKGIAANLDIFNVYSISEKIESACSRDDWATVELEFKILCAEMQALAIAFRSS